MFCVIIMMWKRIWILIIIVSQIRQKLLEEKILLELIKQHDLVGKRSGQLGH